MGRWWWVVLAGCATLAAPAAVPDVRVSIQAEEQPLRELLAALSAQTGFRLELDERVPNRKLSLDLKDQPLAKVLGYLARGAGLIWRDREGGALLTYDPDLYVAVSGLGELPAVGLLCDAPALAKPVSLGLDNVSLTDAFDALQRAGGVGLVADRTLPAGTRLTATFTDTPLSRCLYMIGLAAGVYYRPEPGGRLRVKAPDRVVATRAGQPQPSVIEVWPEGYRGVLAYLVSDEVWREPARYKVKIERDERQQPVLRRTG